MKTAMRNYRYYVLAALTAASMFLMLAEPGIDVPNWRSWFFLIKFASLVCLIDVIMLGAHWMNAGKLPELEKLINECNKED